MGKTLRVAVIVQQGVFRSSLCAALEQCADVEPLAFATVPDRAFSTAPDVIILDLDFQPDNHRELMRRLLHIAPSSRICALAFRALPATVKQCLGLGASGFLLKDCSIDELCRAVKTVANSQVFVDPRVAGALLRGIEERTAPKKSALSERELDVIRLIALGFTNRQIAQELDLSEKTVKNHVSHIFRKLKITARTQAAIHALSNNMLRSES
jgi:DNA-binding NarL/FixJ family response regulator